MPYGIVFDERQSLLTCVINTRYHDAAGPDLLRELKVAVSEARRCGAIKALWDNRAGRALSVPVAAELRHLLSDPAFPDDRVAILVRDSVAKVRARPSLSAKSALFASENAAKTWLCLDTVSAG